MSPQEADSGQSKMPRDDRYQREARDGAIAWKQHTSEIPEEARAPGLYRGHGPLDVCLPEELSRFNLLPDVRSIGLGLFAQEDIRWHDELDTGPSNHLLDSQVQCVNALSPGIADPEFLRSVFGGLLPISEMLPIESDRFLTFEYIGLEDYLGERTNLPRTRGAMTTSVDAAVRYRTPEGAVEMALVEWKFTEDYRGHELQAPRGRPRWERYRPLWESAECPVRHDLVPYEDLFVEPFYQLYRQQMLAWQMERSGEHNAERVVVVHLCPADNLGIHEALNRSSHRDAGTDVLEIWSRLCRQRDRFVSVDAAILLEHRSSEYRDRYDLQL